MADPRVWSMPGWFRAVLDYGLILLLLVVILWLISHKKEVSDEDENEAVVSWCGGAAGRRV